MDPTTRTARKRHSCHWCGRSIEPGERYRYEKVTAWESERGGGDAIFWTYKAHLGCETAYHQSEYAGEMWEGYALEFRSDVLGEPECLIEQDDPLVYRAEHLYEQRRQAILGSRPRRRELEDCA